MDGSKVDYVAWATGEPNFANDDENCVTMYSNSGRQYKNPPELALCVVCHMLHPPRLKLINYEPSQKRKRQ